MNRKNSEDSETDSDDEIQGSLILSLPFNSEGMVEKRAEWIWPNSIVPYKIDVSITATKRAKIMGAISNYHCKTSIIFKDITYNNPQNHPDWVLFKHHEHVTSSFVGRRKGEQKINIADWAEVGNIMHEMMHALGFLHEHSRIDRDGYVSFNEKENLTAPKINYDLGGYPVGSYDPNSLMHYPLCKYMISNHPEAAKMGQRAGFSEGDLKGIAYVYSTPKCTFDHYKNSYHVQTFYECITCWGENSCYGVCVYCSYHCHSGHDLKEHSYTSLAKDKITFVCDCGRYGHKLQLCTRKSTEKRYVKQKMYLCLDCFDIAGYRKAYHGNTPGVCFPCSEKCHKGHDVRFYYDAERFFCDCGLPVCKSNCQA